MVEVAFLRAHAGGEVAEAELGRGVAAVRGLLRVDKRAVPHLAGPAHLAVLLPPFTARYFVSDESITLTHSPALRSRCPRETNEYFKWMLEMNS